MRGAEARLQAAAQRPLDRLGLLEDLLAHEVAVAAAVVVLGAPVDLRRRLGSGPVVERGGVEAAGVDGRQLAVVEIGDLMRVAHERGDVGGDEHLLVADAEDHRAAVARGDDPPRLARVEHREPVGPLDAREGGAHRALQVRVGERDQVGEHLGVGVGRERHAGVLELLAQLGRVLEDAVVDHRDAPGGVQVGMRVAVARLAVRGPAGVGDAGRAGQPLGQARREPAHLALGLVRAQGAVLDDGDPRGVIAPVLQPGQSFDEHRDGVLAPHIADDPAHSSIPFSRR